MTVEGSPVTDIVAAPSFATFAIGFDPRDRARVIGYWQEIFASNRWTEGEFTKRFEGRWAEWNGLPAVAMSSWTGGAMTCMAYFKLQGKTVLCPTNTFMATPLAVVQGGGRVVFGDCRREDLCLSFEAVEAAANEHDLGAVWLVHVGGHIAFDVERIARFCAGRGIVLLEDCAHAHGASWYGRKPGSWGDAGVYSFYGTKTISTGEGGMLVSKHDGLIEFARRFRNYGKPDYGVAGLNYRMSEFTAALGLVQTERLDEIVAWKNDVARRELDSKFARRVRLPDGMTSGYYKYIVFECTELSTGKVYDQLCHQIMGRDGSYPNAEWVARNHWCVPLYYRPADDNRGSNA
jgi:dTDP-4-amino-4,6-dideoxygalactose transaminase